MRTALCYLVFTTASMANAQFGSLGSVAEVMRPNDPVSIVFQVRSVHTLEDGTVVTTGSRQWFYRDGQGRVRIENEVPNPGDTSGESLRTVHVSDPVKMESKFWSVGGPRLDHTYSVVKARMPAPMEALPAPGKTTIIPRTAPGIDPNDPRVPHTVRDAKGEVDIDGAKCDSLETTTTYAVGSFGNDRVVTVRSENCISREFGMPIRETHEDPRTGRSTLTMTSIKREEPDPSVFEPPADYTERPMGAAPRAVQPTLPNR